MEVEEVRHVVLQVAAHGWQLVDQLYARSGEDFGVAHAAKLQDLGGCYCAATRSKNA